MIHQHEVPQLGEIAGTIIAVAQIVGVKPIGERLAAYPQRREKRVMTENFKTLVACFICIYGFYF